MLSLLHLSFFYACTKAKQYCSSCDQKVLECCSSVLFLTVLTKHKLGLHCVVLRVLFITDDEPIEDGQAGGLAETQTV